VINKSDLGDAAADFYRAQFAHTVSMCAERGEGLEALADLTERLFLQGDIDVRHDAVLTNARQSGAALSALSAVRNARAGLYAGLAIELCCSDAERAMEAIAMLDGRAISEDIVAQIFSHFCVGK
jgi:tRNA modification GTPase